MAESAHARQLGGADRAGSDDLAGRLKSEQELPQSPAAKQQPRLNRETFRASRLLDFCSQRELVAQTGHEVEEWPLVVIKELTDNGLDIAEESDIAPELAITVSTQTGEIVVIDNGPGIPAETINSIIDYSTRTSSRAAYCSPSRGQQGNALSTILAMPFVLDGTVGETVIEARGIAHRIRFSAHPIKEEPRIACDRASSTVRTGTRVTVRWPAKACHLIEDVADRFLPFVWDYVALNPHLSVTLEVNGEQLIPAGAPDPAWRKWRPSDPIPAHWYTREAFQRLIAACVARDLEDRKKIRSVRDFIGGFHGLAGTAKRSVVLDETGLFRATLGVFFDGDRVDHAGIARLLLTMQSHSRPVKPEALGLIGEQNFRSVFAADEADQERFKYCRILGEDRDLPYIVEAAFAPSATVSSTPLVCGINWSAAIHNPFKNLGYLGLDTVLSQRHVQLYRDPVLVAVHLACPTVQFVDRGKSATALGRVKSIAVIEAVKKVTKNWCEAWEKADRARRSASRQIAKQQQEEHAEVKRQRATTVGTGVLHAEIAAAAGVAGLSITELTVLSPGNDPYRRDTTDGHRDGKWFAEQVARFIQADARVHLRGLFYRIVSAGGVKRPDGVSFVNDFDCWAWLQNKASKAARWLGYVPHERIRDERNEPPRVIAYAPLPSSGLGCLSAGAGIDLPVLDGLIPDIAGNPPVAQQPYRIIMIGEKSSLAEVLLPIATEVEATLLLPTGEASDTMIAEEVMRAVDDARPAVVLYFSDFDPSGWQMPISVARKLQAMRSLRYPNLTVDVHRVAMTLDQVRSLGLPSTPLKATEKRADKWRARMGHEQTEIDALAALQPDELRRIAYETLEPFYDFTLDDRCEGALSKWQSEARKKLHAHPAWPEIKASVETAQANLEAAAAALHQLQQEAKARLEEGEGGISEIEIPLPEVQIETPAPAPLFTTDDDFITATRKLIASKALAPEEVDNTGDDGSDLL